MFRTPRTRDSPTECLHSAADVSVRPLEDSDRQGVEIAFAPDPARESASGDSIRYHPAKQPTFECMDANMFVRNAVWIDHAAYDKTSAGQLVPSSLIVLHQGCHRLPSEPPHGC